MVERIEIITGKERRRRWSEDERRQLVAEAFAPGAVVSYVARLHGVAESCLYAWRKRFGIASAATADRPRLIPVMVGDATAAVPPPPVMPPQAVVTLPDGTRLEIAAGYPAMALRALFAALRRN